ncbi:MaoC/PaaZ C-terminal domain-containing protein [Amycolatopsis sp. NPDC098790]|uniref:MaoC/PaaZ C-terminal domain-containing protein n=1 Tax=Amycolatopsis sp. NPDC098790 TaxID=3363939 RepID=UPI003813D5AB
MKFDPAGLDKWTEPVSFDVTRSRLVDYALATNDPIPAHVSGDVASPVFAIVPVFQSLLEPALEVVPPSLFGRVLHGEQDFRFHRPIRPGDSLVSRAKMTGWEGLPKGTRATVYLECRSSDGALVNEQYVTFFVRGFDTGSKVGELGPSHRGSHSGSPIAQVAQHVDDDQTFRYGPAAGDPMPIHLDEEVARAAGLPGIIAHGLCTMAFTSWAVLTSVAPAGRLRRLAVRFAAPVLPGQDLSTSIWAAGSRSFAFETKVGDTVVIKDGLAEL